MRRAARVDDNHLAIVRALEKAGAAVTSLATVGDGVADLLVSYRNRWHVIEVKDGSKPPSATHSSQSGSNPPARSTTPPVARNGFRFGVESSFRRCSFVKSGMAANI